MIKINLAIKEEKGGAVPQEWIIVGFFAVVVLIAMIGIYLSNGKKISKLEDEIKNAKAEEQRLQKTITKLNQLKKQKNDLEKKNKVIDELNRGRQLWPKIMRLIVDNKPEQLWIKSMGGSSTEIQISGNCFSHLNVAQFMENLKKDPMVQDVVLRSTVAGAEKSTTGGDLVTFALQVKLK